MTASIKKNSRSTKFYRTLVHSTLLHTSSHIYFVPSTVQEKKNYSLVFLPLVPKKSAFPRFRHQFPGIFFLLVFREQLWSYKGTKPIRRFSFPVHPKPISNLLPRPLLMAAAASSPYPCSPGRVSLVRRCPSPGAPAARLWCGRPQNPRSSPAAGGHASRRLHLWRDIPVRAS